MFVARRKPHNQQKNSVIGQTIIQRMQQEIAFKCEDTAHYFLSQKSEREKKKTKQSNYVG